MSNTNNAVVGDLKTARSELRQKPSAVLQHLKRGMPFLRSDALPKIGWGFLSG